MKTLQNPVFIGCFLVAFMVYTAGLLSVTLPNWVVFYLNDFLCMPLVFLIILAILRQCKQDPGYRIPIFPILSLTLYYIWFFEVYTPQHNPRYTADFWDAVLYGLGSTFFFIVQRKGWV